MFWYSIGVWRYINDYFRDKLVEVLRQENETKMSAVFFASRETCGVHEISETCMSLVIKQMEDNQENVCYLREYAEEIFRL